MLEHGGIRSRDMRSVLQQCLNRQIAEQEVPRRAVKRLRRQLKGFSPKVEKWGSSSVIDGRPYVTICSQRVEVERMPEGEAFLVLRLGASRLSVTLERPDMLPETVFYRFNHLPLVALLFGWAELRAAVDRLGVQLAEMPYRIR